MLGAVLEPRVRRVGENRIVRVVQLGVGRTSNCTEQFFLQAWVRDNDAGVQLICARKEVGGRVLNKFADGQIICCLIKVIDLVSVTRAAVRLGDMRIDPIGDVRIPDAIRQVRRVAPGAGDNRNAGTAGGKLVLHLVGEGDDLLMRMDRLTSLAATCHREGRQERDECCEGQSKDAFHRRSPVDSD